jgi:5'-nucleotidase/UDP-sugar diphosphatase
MKLLLGLTTAIGMTFSASAAMADYSLSIFHFNDFHARFESISKYDSSCSEKNEAQNKCFGGIARVKTKLDERRAELKATGQDSILAVAGDAFQGTLFYTKFKGKATADFFNQLDIDGFALGNHEFDDGPEVLSKFIDMVKFPILGGNIDFSGEPLLADKVPGVRIINKGAKRVALIGIVTTDTPNIASPGENTKFIDNQVYLKGIIPQIKSVGVNKIVVISHAGYPEDVDLAENVPGIDVIVGGHSNTFMSNTNARAATPYPDVVRGPDNNLVAIVQAYAYSKYLGELKVDFDDAGNVISASGDPHLLDSSVKPDADLSAQLAKLAEPLNAEKNIVVAVAAASIDGNRESCRAVECEMGNLITDAMLDRTKGQGISIAIQNGGGIRASIDAGDITKGEILTVLPFLNTLSTFKLKGSDVIAALENGVSQVEDVKGRFPQVSGLRYAWDSSVAPLKGRIKQVQVSENGAWVDIDPAKIYGVATNNFVRSGGDGYKVFTKNGMDAYDFGPGVEDVVIAYLKDHGPYKPHIEGRIVAGTSLAAAMKADMKKEMKAEMKKEMKASEEATEGEYVVKAGDSLWKIAKKHYGDATMYTKIRQANGAKNVRVLKIGQKLKLPK